MFVVLAPMRSELAGVARALGMRRAVRAGLHLRHARVGGREVVAVQAGVGTRRAGATATTVLERLQPATVAVVGIAGGVGTVRVGDLVVPATVLDLHSHARLTPDPVPGHEARGVLATSDDLVVDPDHLAALAEIGVVALDMESAAVGAACEAHGVPWWVLRGISDLATDHRDDGILSLVDPDGRPRPGAAARFVGADPRRLPTLVRLARGAARATRVAAGALRRALETGAAPA